MKKLLIFIACILTSLGSSAQIVGSSYEPNLTVTPPGATANALPKHNTLIAGVHAAKRPSGSGTAGRSVADCPSPVITASGPTTFCTGGSVMLTASVSADATVSTLAGSTIGYAEGTGAAAQFKHPAGVATDAAGNVYVADFDDHRIRKITPAGLVSTLAGSTRGYADGTGAAAKFSGPRGVATDAAGNVYVGDMENQRIRKITPAGEVSTLAGSTYGYAEGNGAAAQFANPDGVATDAAGNVYVADYENHRIRKITPAGAVSTLAGSTEGYAEGTGAEAKFYYPSGVATDAAGNVYVTDAYNHRIRKITPAGLVSTLAGSTPGYAEGAGAEAKFYYPFGLALDAAGNVYVADRLNHRICKITPSGLVSTLAGSTYGYAEGTGAEAKFNHPYGLALDAAGNVYVADEHNYRIRKITFAYVTDVYLWSNGATTQSITATAPGSYTVQTISNGCTSAASEAVVVTVNQAATPVISASGSTSFCTGGSVTLTSGTASGNIWSNGETTESITVSASGSYSVQTISNGCTSAVSNAVAVTVNPIPATPTISASGSTTFCTGGSVTLTSGTAPGNLWSNGETTQSITVSAAGSYSVQTISSGCTSSVSNAVAVTVNPMPATPTISASGSTTFCIGGNVTLTSSALSGNLWSSGETTQSITVSASGSYSVQTISNGCTSAVSNAVAVTINPIPATPTISASGSTTFCTGGSVTLTSGTASGNIWSNGETTESITVSASGSYSVQTINSGCTSAVSNAVAVTVNPAPAMPLVTVSGDTNICGAGSVRLTSSLADSIIWSNGETTQSITVSTAGSYWVQSVSSQGCTSAVSAQTTLHIQAIPAAPDFTVIGDTVVCGAGSITLTSSIAEGYVWSNGETGQSITVSTAGNYSVRAVSAAGCTSAASRAVPFVINAVPAMPLVTVSGDTNICGSGSVTLTSSAAVGNLWSNSETSRSITVSTAGSYSVRSVSAAGCTSAVSVATMVHVNAIPAAPDFTISGDTVICGAGSITLTSTIADGNVWSNGETGQSITVSTAGNYSVRSVSAAGCTSAASRVLPFVINAVPLPGEITISSPVTFCAGGNTTLSGDAGFGYIWSNGATDRAITVSVAGSYTLRLVSGSCTGVAGTPVVVTVNPTPQTPGITASGPLSFCAGDSVILTSSALSGNRWTNGATTQSVTIKSSGAYSVLATNGECISGEASEVTVTVTPVPGKPRINNTAGAVLCAGETITLESSSPTGSLWSNNATGQTMNAGVSGTYTVRVVSGACTSEASDPYVLVVNPRPVQAVLSRSGDSIIANPRTGASYKWYLGSDLISGWTTFFVANPVPGVYTAYIVNDFNCASEVISEPLSVVAGISEMSTVQHSLSPNPAGNSFSILGLGRNENIELLDNLGRSVMKATVTPGIQTDISTLPTGLYYVRIAGRSLKLVKN